MMNKIFCASMTVMLILFTLSCTNPRKLQDTLDRNEHLEAANRECNERMNALLLKNDTLIKQVKFLKKQVSELASDTALFGRRYRKIEAMNIRLESIFDQLNKKYQDLLSICSGENQNLSLELENKKRELDKKELELKALEKSLKEREARIKELESILNKKDSVVNALKQKITEALLGFKESELSVELKNGKVYVSLSDQLLFKSGSITVDSKGITALNKLSNVLEKNPDINILIEGHTDNVEMKKGGQMVDNWDLSVLRATSIVRILTAQNNIDPGRITAAGRSKHHPVAANTSATGRSKNRRTEIILSPNLDELFEILKTN